MRVEDEAGGEQASSPVEVLGFGPFTFDPEVNRLARDGVEVHLTPKAAAVLCQLLQRPGEVIAKDEFLEVVWEGVHVREESLTQAISVIRHAIGDSSQSAEFIQTVPGEGYRFIGQVSRNGKGVPSDPAAAKAAPGAAPVAVSGSDDGSSPIAGAPDRAEEPPPDTRPRLPGAIAAGLAVIAFAVVAVFVFDWFRGPPEDDEVDIAAPMRFSLELPPEAPLAPPGSFFLGAGRPSLVLSPDGRSLVYVARVGSGSQLYLRDMGTGETRPVEGTASGHGPAFSPEGDRVVFFAESKLKTVSLTGGSALEIADAVWGHGAAWGDDGYIYFTADELGHVTRVPAGGGVPPQPLTKLDVGSSGHVWPTVIPATDWFLFTNRYFPPVVTVASKEAAVQPRVLTTGSGARFVPTGHLTWVRNGRWVGAPLDTEAMRLTGDPVALIDDVQLKSWAGQAYVTWSRTGTLVYAPGSDLNAGRFVWVGENGEPHPLPGLDVATFSAFALSPDESKLAYTRIDGTDASVWLYDFEDKMPERLTYGPSDRVVGWMPAGDAVLFTSRRPDGGGLYRVGLDAADRKPMEIIGEAVPNAMATDRGLAYQAGTQDIMFAPWGEDGRTLEILDARAMVATPYLEAFPAVSPDGKWLAYMSDETEHWEIHVVDLPVGSNPRRVSYGGGEEPRWSADGTEIIYRFGTEWRARSFSAESEIVLGPERTLFHGPYINVGGYSWDMSRDGRFLVIENPDLHRSITRLEGMTNFFAWLNHRIPNGKGEAR